MFLGTYEPRLDDKGRLILPATFREALAPGIVLTRGQERCLYGFPRAEFERVHGQMQAASLTSKQARDFQRVLLSGASDEIPDKQGRLTVPPIQIGRASCRERGESSVGAGGRAVNG